MHPHLPTVIKAEAQQGHLRFSRVDATVCAPGTSECGVRGVPVEIMLCSRVPSLLDDMETRLWKYMHRLQNGLGLKGEDAAEEDGAEDPQLKVDEFMQSKFHHLR